MQQGPFAGPIGSLYALEFDIPSFKVCWPTFVSAKFSRSCVGPLERSCWCGSEHASSLRVPCDAGYKTMDMHWVQVLFDFIGADLVRLHKKVHCDGVQGELFGAPEDCKAFHHSSLFFDCCSSGCAVGEVLLRDFKQDCRLQVLLRVLKDGAAAQSTLSSQRPRSENRRAIDVGILGSCGLEEDSFPKVELLSAPTYVCNLKGEQRQRRKWRRWRGATCQHQAWRRTVWAMTTMTFFLRGL